MKEIYMLKYSVNSNPNFAAFEDKESAEHVIEFINNHSKSGVLGDIEVIPYEISLYNNLTDFLDELGDKLN